MADVDPAVLLDSTEAIKHNMTPFGRKLGIVMDDPHGMALYRIKYVDNKPGSLPDELSGRWTTLAHCTNDLKAYLYKQWTFSDAKKQKAERPLATKSSTLAKTTESNNYIPKSQQSTVQ